MLTTTSPTRHFIQLVVFIGCLALLLGAGSAAVRASETPLEPEPERPIFAVRPPLPANTDLLPPAVESGAAPAFPDYYTRMIYTQLSPNYYWELRYTGTSLDTMGNRASPEMESDFIYPRLLPGGIEMIFSFALNSNSYLQLYRMPVGGAQNTMLALTNSPGDSARPCLSKDGLKIVFEYVENGNAEIYLMNSVGGGRTRLTNHPDFDGMPCFSPDGQKIIFSSRRSGGYRIYTMNLDGSELTQLNDQPYSAYPVWSPDGKWIAYTADSDGNGWLELWVMAADGSNPRLAVNPGSPYDIYANDWSPDGRHIAFSYLHLILYNGNWYLDDVAVKSFDTLYWTYGEDLISYSEFDWYADWVSLDTQPPTIQVNPIPEQSPAQIRISWTGQETGGAGELWGQVQYRLSAQDAWQNYGEPTDAFYKDVLGVGGFTNQFRVIARDRHYNTTDPNLALVLQTYVEAAKPVVIPKDLPSAASTESGASLAWDAYDPGDSGIVNFELQYREEQADTWQPLVDGIGTPIWSFMGELGQSYFFRVRATDAAQNQSDWYLLSPTPTHFYAWRAAGQAFDHAGTPLQLDQLDFDPPAYSSLTSAASGDFLAYGADLASNHTLQVSKTLLGQLPALHFTESNLEKASLWLPPADNLIANSSFEDHPSQLTGWISHGVTTTLGADQRLSGAAGLQLGHHSAYPVGFDHPEQLSLSFDYDYCAASDSQGRLHVILYDCAAGVNPAGGFIQAWLMEAEDGNHLYYSLMDKNDQWSPTIEIPLNDPELVDDKLTILSDRVAIAIREPDTVQTNKYRVSIIEIFPDTTYLVIPVEGIYENSDFYYMSELIVDQNDALHLVTPQDDIIYYRIYTGSSWFTHGIFEFDSLYSPRVLDFRLASNGDPFLIIDLVLSYKIVTRPSTGSWFIDDFNELDDADPYGGDLQFTVDSQNRLVIYYFKNLGSYHEIQKLLVSSTGERSVIPTGITFPGSLGSRVYLRCAAFWGEDQVLLCGSTGDNQTHWFKWQLPDSTWDEFIISGYSSYYDRTITRTTPQGQVYIIREKDSGSDLYSPATAPQASTSSVSQAVSLPPDLTSPLLSFAYRLHGVTTAQTGGLNLLIESAGGTQSFAVPAGADPSVWSHYTLDVSPWLSQTITATLQVDQPAGMPWVWAEIDDVALGSTLPDAWNALRVSSNSSATQDEITLRLDFGNRGAAPALTATLSLELPAPFEFVSASLPPLDPQADTLTWTPGDLSAHSADYLTVTLSLPPGAELSGWQTFYASLATANPDLEADNQSAQAQVWVGQRILLPVLLR